MPLGVESKMVCKNYAKAQGHHQMDNRADL